MTRIHCCLFDRECWSDHFEFGMPLRLHIGDRFWTVPFSGRRLKRMFAEGEWVQSVAPIGWRCEHVSVMGSSIVSRPVSWCGCTLKPIFHPTTTSEALI